MSVITFTATLAAQILSLRWSQIRSDFSFSSAFGSQGVEVSSPSWGVQLASRPLQEVDSGEWKALLMNLDGQVNQLALWDTARPAPVGTMRGTTMRLSAAAAQGATSLTIYAFTTGIDEILTNIDDWGLIDDQGSAETAKTLKAGDLLGLGSGTTQQVVMVTADATSDASGFITVSIKPPLRNAMALEAAVTWDKPKALFRRTQSPASWDYNEFQAGGFALDLIEDVRA